MGPSRRKSLCETGPVYRVVHKPQVVIPQQVVNLIGSTGSTDLQGG